MKDSERIQSLKNDIPELKEEIIQRSKTTVKGMNYIYVSQALTVCIADLDAHYASPALIMFPSGPFGEKTFENILKEDIRREYMYPEIN